MRLHRAAVALAGALAAASVACAAPATPFEASLQKPPGTVRIATFDASLTRKGAGVLARDIAEHDPQVMAVAEILLTVRPDIVLLNEIDYDSQGVALGRLLRLLGHGVAGLPGLNYDHSFAAPPNSGFPSRMDLDGDGLMMGPGDALGYGDFPGNGGMAILSRYPLGHARTFRHFRWADLPGAEPPRKRDGTLFWLSGVWNRLPLSSRSHWDVTAALPGGLALHLLASHPTPPVFDGFEDRNGLRNAAEIAFWSEYLDGTEFPDDDGTTAALPSDAAVVVLGALNLDPADGDGRRDAIRALLANPRLQDPKPTSEGGRAAAKEGGANRRQDGDPALDTADWPKDIGNMRVDYVLPSAGLDVAGAGVFWPPADDPLARLIAAHGRKRTSSDHRLVWVDIRARL